MIEIAEMLAPQPTALWKLVRQAGVAHAVGSLPFKDCNGDEKAWELAPMRRMKARLEDAGFILAVIESSPPMQEIRLGLPGRDAEIEAFCAMLRSMGELGIPVLCYNFMAVFGWLRTHMEIPWRGGALVTGYDHRAMKDLPHTAYGEVPEARLWDNFECFLNRVLPVAEDANVKLALHPDDPPLSPIRGIGRIMRSLDGFQRVLDLAPSPCNGLTFCQGNFTLMTDDLPAAIRHFGRQGKIFFVHFRDVQGTPERFVETFHEEGKTDMLACMQSYREIGFEGVLRPDHVPTLEGDSNDNPCYSNIGRLYAIGYIRGLREAVYGKEPPASVPGARADGEMTAYPGLPTEWGAERLPHPPSIGTPGPAR
jgi:mannonate dehydratase